MNSYDIAFQGWEYLVQLIKQHDLCTACVKIVSKQDVLVENIKVSLHQKHHFQPEKTKAITSALIQNIIAEAKQAEGTEFSLLCRNTLVALCGGLESLVKDVVSASILEKKNNLEKLGNRSMKIELVDLLAKSDEERARIFVDSLFREETSKNGHTNKLLRLLEYVDGKIEVDRQIQLTIDEAFEVRNVIVHRGSKVDDQLKSKIPNIRQEVGDSVEMSTLVFRSYKDAIFNFAETVISSKL